MLNYNLQVKQHTDSTMTPWNLLQLLRRSCRPQNNSWGQDDTQILKTDQIRIFSDHVYSVGFCLNTEYPLGKQLEFRAATNLVYQMFSLKKNISQTSSNVSPDIQLALIYNKANHFSNQQPSTWTNSINQSIIWEISTQFELRSSHS